MTLDEIDNGVEIGDLAGYSEFSERQLHVRDVEMQLAGMRRLMRAFVESPETILQVLVDAAVDLCGADSAGITLEHEAPDGEHFYEWVATAGLYEGDVGARLPRYPSPCGICLDRGQAQHFRVTQPFFDLLGVEAPLVTDGILLPWEVDGTRGTVWIVAHGRREAFDGSDWRMMEALADFAAMAVRQQKQQSLLLQQASVTAVATLANELAHQINNPLQSLTNLMYLAAEGEGDVKKLGVEASGDLKRLSELVRKLLVLPERL